MQHTPGWVRCAFNTTTHYQGYGGCTHTQNNAACLTLVHIAAAQTANRDPANRLRMMAVPYGSARGRTAASNYQMLEVVAAGGAALVQWRLETGRTHQIRWEVGNGV